MKKILAIMLCLVMIFSMIALVSCDEEEKSTSTSSTTNGNSTGGNTPPVDKGGSIATVGGMTVEQAYQSALNKIENMTNLTMTTNQNITVSAQGQSFDMVNSIVIKMDGQNIYVKMENQMYPETNMTCWYVDDWVYVIAEGAQAKANITYDEFISEYAPGGATSEGALLEFPIEWFKDVKFYQDGESYYIKLVMSSEEYLKYVGESTDANISAADDITYKIYFDENGELDYIVTEFDFVVEGMNFSTSAKTIVTDAGTTSVEAPSGNFIDVTGQMKK